MKRKIRKNDRIAGIKQSRGMSYALKEGLLVRKRRKRHLWRIGLGQPSLLQKSIAKCSDVSNEYAGRGKIFSLLGRCRNRRTRLLPMFEKVLPEKEIVVSEFRKRDSWIRVQCEAFRRTGLAGRCEAKEWKLLSWSFCVAGG